MTPLQVLAERECIYQVLSQTTPENLNKNHSDYTIDPNTRYLILPKTMKKKTKKYNSLLSIIFAGKVR